MGKILGLSKCLSEGGFVGEKLWVSEVLTEVDKAPLALSKTDAFNDEPLAKLETSIQVVFSPARTKHSVPPAAAYFLLDLLLAKIDREAIMGDMEEQFEEKLAKYGPTGARGWFWGETARTIATRNPICRWLLVWGLTRVGEWIFRKIGG
jgi:hypothetical protein